MSTEVGPVNCVHGRPEGWACEHCINGAMDIDDEFNRVLRDRDELLEALHGLADNYELDDDCACDRCTWLPKVRALMARIEGTPEGSAGK